MARLYTSMFAILLLLTVAAPRAHADHVDELIVEASSSPSPMRRLRAAIQLAKVDDPRADAARERLAAKAHQKPLRRARARIAGGSALVPRAVSPAPTTPASCVASGAGSLNVAC
jgi:hypothetical protein